MHSYTLSRMAIKGRGPDAARQGILPCPRPFFCFNDRSAAINRRNDSVGPKKGLNFWRRFFFNFIYFSVFTSDSSKKRPQFLAKTFFVWFMPLIRLKKALNIFRFWSAGMVAAGWNLVRTECGPPVQKVAEPRPTLTTLPPSFP